MLTNMRGFPQSKPSFKFSRKEGEPRGERAPPRVTKHENPFNYMGKMFVPRLPEIAEVSFTSRHSETVTTAATAASGSLGA